MTNDVLRELETWLRSQSEDFGALARSYHTRTGQDSVALLKETERHRRYADALSALLRERDARLSIRQITPKDAEVRPLPSIPVE